MGSKDEFNSKPIENTKILWPTTEKRRTYDILYINVILHLIMHVSALYGLYLCFASAKWPTVFFALFLHVVQFVGLTAGSHRLWSHRSYKANTPLQILIMLMTTLAFQWTAADWVRNHRMHHKYSDTDADPHNARRGFFYSHYGWLLVRKHSEVKRLGKYLDMNDIYNNPVLKFQKKYAVPLFTTICFILPTIIPMYFWSENLNNSWHVATILRWVVGLHSVFVVNSISHTWGYRPYDKTIKPTENIYAAVITMGEGSHNYHHTFPWDYRSAELANVLNYTNLTKQFIDFFAWLGWAYDLKTVPESVAKERAKRTGEITKRLV